MTTLIDRFLDGSRKEGHNFIAWKTHFKRYCNMPAQEDKGLRSDFSYLERRGLLSVGRYSILNKIFQKFDPRAVSFINKVSEEMAALPSENRIEKKTTTLKIDAYILPVEKAVEKALWEILHDTVTYIESTPDPIATTDETIELLNSNSTGGSKKKPKLKNLIDKSVKLIKELRDEKGSPNQVSYDVIKAIFHLYQKMRKTNHLKGLKVGPKGNFTLLADFSTEVDLKSCLTEGTMKTLKNDVSDFFASSYNWLGIDMKYGKVIVEVKEVKATEVKAKLKPSTIPLDIRTPERKIPVSTLHEICHLTFVLPDLLWASDSEGTIILVNPQGEVLDTLNTQSHECGKHAVTNTGELLYLDHGCVMRHVLGHGSKPLVTEITFGGWWEWSIFCSHQNGDILVGMTDENLDHGRVVRFNKLGKLMQTIEYDDRNKLLYSVPRYIVENVNRDVCTSDNAGIVVVDKTGKHRFTYDLKVPHGLCVNSHGHIIACNWTSAIHVINHNGHLLCIMGVETRDVISLSIDEEDNLYAGSDSSNIVSVYKVSLEKMFRK